MTGRVSGGATGRLIGMAVVIALVASACGSAAPAASGDRESSAASTPAAGLTVAPATSAPTQTAAPTPAPTPTPSPSIDTASAVVATFRDPVFSARAKLSGEVSIRGARYAVEGAATYRGRDGTTVITIRTPGAGTTTETATVGGTSWSRTGSGPWFPVAADAGGKGIMTAVDRLTDRGLVTVDGRSLRRLAVDGPLSPADIGFAGAGPASGTATLEILATETGSPVLLRATASWTQASGAKAVPMAVDLEIAFTCTGCVASIPAPTPVFKAYSSKKLGYSLAVPDDWDADLAASAKDADTFYSPDDAFVVGSRYSAGGYTLNAIVKAYLDLAKRGKLSMKKFQLEKSRSVTVGGVRGRLLTYHATFAGARHYVITLLVVRKGQVTEISLADNPGDEAADRALMDLVMATFAFR